MTKNGLAPHRGRESQKILARLFRSQFFAVWQDKAVWAVYAASAKWSDDLERTEFVARRKRMRLNQLSLPDQKGVRS